LNNGIFVIYTSLFPAGRLDKKGGLMRPDKPFKPLHKLYPVISHQSSVISHQSSVISHQSSVISHQSILEISSFFVKPLTA
jgi:hypothetical protein